MPQYIFCYRERVNKDVSGAQRFRDVQSNRMQSKLRKTSWATRAALVAPCRVRGTSLYVVMLGGYRVFYALNWIYKKVTSRVTCGEHMPVSPLSKSSCPLGSAFKNLHFDPGRSTCRATPISSPGLVGLSRSCSS